MLHISSCKSVILANLSIIVFCVACFSFIFLFCMIHTSVCHIPFSPFSCVSVEVSCGNCYLGATVLALNILPRMRLG